MQRTDSDSESPSSGALLRVVVAEDHPDSRDALQALLEAHGYEVAVARDGREAIDRVEERRPALVLMDIMMPGMDGLEATRRIREHPELADLPILALTAMEGSRERALEAGCDDWIGKPIDIRSFFGKVRWWVEHGRGAGPAQGVSSTG